MDEQLGQIDADEFEKTIDTFVEGRSGEDDRTPAPTFFELLAGVEGSEDPLVGTFSREPDLIDQVLDAAMQARETHPLRVPSR